MKIIYRAENIIDANLIKGLLEHEGIQAFVGGSYLQGGVGELPASGLVNVSVADEDTDEDDASASGAPGQTKKASA